MESIQAIEHIVDFSAYPLDDVQFQQRCRDTLDNRGCLKLPGFITASACASIECDGDRKQDLAYFCLQAHSAYLTPHNDALPPEHPANRNVQSSKGCITDDQIDADSPLRHLYDSQSFRQFLCAVLREVELHEYADNLSSINLHYASAGQELGWHFDNSSFAITLLIRQPDDGGVFEYISDMRDANGGEMNYAGVADVLDSGRTGTSIDLDPGTLLLFRGRDALHRVTPVTGSVTRMLAVLAYNSEPGIELSESARMTFYGRLD